MGEDFYMEVEGTPPPKNSAEHDPMGLYVESGYHSDDKFDELVRLFTRINQAIPWIDMYHILERYYKAHGTIQNIPKSVVYRKGKLTVPLQYWVSHQRHLYHCEIPRFRLSEKQIELLEALKIDWHAACPTRCRWSRWRTRSGRGRPGCMAGAHAEAAFWPSDTPTV